MGLDDLIPDTENKSSSRVPNNGSSEDDDDDIVKSFGKPPYQKKFTEEQWEKVKRVVHEEFGMKIGSVVNSPEQERYELLHEAITFSESEEEEETEHSSKTRCYYCGKACDDANVELADELFCTHHTVAQAHSALRED